MKVGGRERERVREGGRERGRRKKEKDEKKATQNLWKLFSNMAVSLAMAVCFIPQRCLRC